MHETETGTLHAAVAEALRTNLGVNGLSLRTEVDGVGRYSLVAPQLVKSPRYDHTLAHSSCPSEQHSLLYLQASLQHTPTLHMTYEADDTRSQLA